MSGSVRPAAVAGLFYPDDPEELRTVVDDLLQAAPAEGTPPKAIIAPHAGYVFSGEVAARAYARLTPGRARVRRVVLLGPAHRVPVRGIAAPSVDYFETPLGKVPVDQAAIAALAGRGQVTYHDETHRMEHSLEVHLPFLQRVFDNVSLVPLVVGDSSPEQVAAVLEGLWGGEETLVVISTDLSHFHEYDDARHRDARTSRHIEALDYEHIHYDDACGRNPVNGLLYLARDRGLGVSMLEMCNSGDTAGPRDRVVGYGAYVLTGEPA